MIQVLDAMCGAGKSTAIFKMMRDNPEKKYVYITPFLTEVEERIPAELPELEFFTPECKAGKGKVVDFKMLVGKGCNIASTHTLYSMLTAAIVDMLIKQEYTLIIDEAINCIGLLPADYKPSDIKALLAGELVKVAENTRGRLEWNEDKFPKHDGKYAKIRNLCNLGMLYSHKDTFLMWEACPKLMKGLPNIYLLSYLFEGSDMYSWLTLNELPFTYMNHKELGLRSEVELKAIARDCIELVSNRNLNNLRQSETALSNRWFNNASKETTDKYKAMIRSLVVKERAKKGDIFWTTHKEHCGKLAGRGYTIGTEKGATAKWGNSFLPCNLRATNDYSDYNLCVYAMNRYKNPVEVGYMVANGGKVNEDAFAVGELLQFAWRGCARKGKPMKLFIMSKRMERLFKEWLYE